MTAYSYSISLRLWHPTIGPEEITAALNIQPGRSWVAWAPRTTASGRPMRGINADNFWTVRLCDDVFETPDLRSALKSQLSRLSIHKQFFNSFVESGGGAEFFIGWVLEQTNSGDVLDHALFTLLADLKIDLSFDIYAGRDDDLDSISSADP
jgi:hypothetical protein